MERKKISINIFLIIMIIILAIIQVIIVNHDSTAGQKLTTVLKEIEKTEQENSRFNQKIASASSMVSIAAKAKEYGLVDNQTAVSLGSSLPIAQSGRLSL